MQLPAAYARRLLNISDIEKTRAILTTAAREMAELQDLPARVTDPNYLRSLGEEDGGG